MQEKWIIAKASVIGSLHIKNNIPCQDSHLCEFIEQSEWGIALVADGAGSCEFSHIGSKKVIEFSLLHFKKLIEEHKWIANNQFPEVDYWHSLAKENFKKVLLDLENFAVEENYTLHSLSTTIILIIFSPIGLLVSHIGDGRAGYCTSEGEWKSIITPFKGEYANETVFITSPIWQDEIVNNFIESNVIIESIKSFVMLTDGCENTCYETTLFNEETQQYEHINKPFSGFFNPISETVLNLFENNKTENEINKLWSDYLTNGTEEFSIEQDDKTLILAVKYDYANS